MIKKAIMIKKVIGVLISVLLMNQLIYVFGKLTALREISDHMNVKVMCVSEDDGGALIWSSHTHNQVLSSNGFHNTCNVSNNDIDCKMDNDKGCLKRWDKKDWKLTRSLDTPMGPVFDQRWEEFTEYKSSTEYNISLHNMDKIVVPFSVFAAVNVHIMICENEDKTNLCYWVIIGGWQNTKSVIRKCLTGMPQSIFAVKHFQNNSGCTDQIYRNHKPLSLDEWRTFLLMWNSVERTISVYDSNEMILSYEDEQIYDSNVFHSISFSMPPVFFWKSGIRYHDYTFLSTDKGHGSSLMSPEFSIENNTICIQLLIGLCIQCVAIVNLVDAITMDKINSVRISGSLNAHGLPMWQLVKITNGMTVPSYNKVKIQISTESHAFPYYPIWGVANVRECLPKGCLRLISRQNPSSTKMTCQKLFYQEQSIVNPFSDINLNVKLDNANCDLGHIGPQCSFNCKSILQRKENCKEIAICNQNGCTCPPGLLGPKCDQSCNEGFYGHACEKKCGSCFQNRLCGPTGICITGCKNNTNYVYLSSLCQTGVYRPNELEIVFTNQTTVVATTPFNWEEGYRREKRFYSFHMKMQDGPYVCQQNMKQIFEYTSKLEGRCENLEPDTSYQMRFILSIAESDITGDWETVETDCFLPYAPHNFSYSLNTTGIVDLKWFHPLKTCGLDVSFFRITVEEISSRLISNASRTFENKTLVKSQTYKTGLYTKRFYLFPSTWYLVSIETMTTQNETSNPIFFEFWTNSSVDLVSKVEILTQDSSSTVLLRIPKASNETRDSITYIILIGPETCEQKAELSKNLLAYVDKDKRNRVWQIVKRLTNEMANNTLTIGDNQLGNCRLKKGDLYEILITISENEFSVEDVIFKQYIPFYFGGPPPSYYEVWFIGIILIFSAFCAIFYFYKK